MIVIVDYGMGNLGSIANMLNKIEVDAIVSSNFDVIKEASKLVLPGVGSFDTAMKRINESGLRQILDRRVLLNETPVLGICLGMQLLTRGSEEGDLKGLGWIDANTVKFTRSNGLKVPHMGWNIVKPSKPHFLSKNLPVESRFYFVHSYHVKVDDPASSLLKCNYGIEFDAAIHHKNVIGVQFHPEKSHKFGMQLLKNWALN